MARLFSLALSWLVVMQRGVDAVRAGVALSGQGANVNGGVKTAEDVHEEVDALSKELVDSIHQHQADEDQTYVEPWDLAPLSQTVNELEHIVNHNEDGTIPSGFDSDGTPIAQWAELNRLYDFADEIDNGELSDDDDAVHSELQKADSTLHDSTKDKPMQKNWKLALHLISEFLDKPHMLTLAQVTQISSDFDEVQKKMSGKSLLQHGRVATQFGSSKSIANSDTELIASVEAINDDHTKLTGQVQSELDKIQVEYEEVEEVVKTAAQEKAEKAEKEAQDKAEKAEKEAQDEAEKAAEKAETATSTSPPPTTTSTEKAGKAGKGY